jgi:hypothetical protein
MYLILNKLGKMPMETEDYILTKKEEERAVQDALKNPILGKLYNYYKLNTEDVFLDLHNSILISLKDITEKIKTGSLKAEDEHFNALINLLHKLGTISVGIGKVKELGNKNGQQEETQKRSFIDQARERTLG